ncbi:hypothetical protein F511_38420 [Dorcoceras hygrometricum]|uniref:Uncharacterized protein n=1 Tax=Dorcoceras hygrometricum TaxID=472368 RepID=A0A2Z7BH74_9LAMI|nr:hypothetical protein F511_38420 [Dorcoceras hygrometricum]
MRTSSNKKPSRRNDRKVLMAEESTKSWADSDSESSSSSSSSSDSEQEETHCLMADHASDDEVFDFANTEFTREDLIQELNDMVHEYKTLSHTFEEIKAENENIYHSTSDISAVGVFVGNQQMSEAVDSKELKKVQEADNSKRNREESDVVLKIQQMVCVLVIISSRVQCIQQESKAISSCEEKRKRYSDDVQEEHSVTGYSVTSRCFRTISKRCRLNKLTRQRFDLKISR